MQIRLNKLDFTELYFSGNKVDALQGIFNGQPGSYKPRRLFCIQFALCLHTYKWKIKGWRADADGGATEPYHCLLTVDSLAVWRRLGWARPRPAVDNTLDPHSSIDRQSTWPVYSLFDRWTIYTTSFLVSIARQSICACVIGFLAKRHLQSLFEYNQTTSSMDIVNITVMDVFSFI